jgi:hypothetical protein
MTQILRFEMNVPAEVALKESGPGKPIEGRYGNRVMYTLADERVMYVAPIVASRISDLGIQPGELFQVCKQIKKQGKQRLIDWQVERVPSQGETQLERDLRESLATVQATKAAQTSGPNKEPEPPPALPESTTSSGKSVTAAAVPAEANSGDGKPPTETRTGNGLHAIVDTGCSCARESPAPLAHKSPSPAVPSSNGSANGFPSAAPKNGIAPPPVTTKLEHALKTAISAAYNAEKYGAELGYVVRFDADAIKSMAITVLINMSEGNRR